MDEGEEGQGMNYANSSLCNSAAAKLLEQAVDKVRTQRNLALNDWLKRCVEQWCPKAYALAQAGIHDEARAALDEGGFHWSSQTMGGDELVTFWQHDVQIERMHIELWRTKVSLPRTGVGSGAIAAWADGLTSAMDAAAKEGV